MNEPVPPLPPVDDLDADLDDPTVGPNIDFTDPNSPLAPYYFQASHVAATLLIALIFVFFNLTPLGHSDVWGHLKIGEWIVHNQRLPDHELFSPYADRTLPASNFQWLTQTLYYGTFRAGEWLAGGSALQQTEGGIDALRSLHAFCQAAKAFFLLLAFRRFAASMPLAIVGVVLVFVFSPSVQRPQVLAEVLFAATLWLLSRPLLPTSPIGTPGGEGRGEGGQDASRNLEASAGTSSPAAAQQPGCCEGSNLSWRSTAALIVLLILWANIHGSFLIGIALAGVFWFGGVLESIRARGFSATIADKPLHRPLVAAILGTIGLSLLNPHGLHAIPDVLAFAKNPNILTMQEWQPLDFSSGGGGRWTYLILLVLILLTQAVSPRVYGPTQILVLALFGLGPLLQERLMTWWCMLAPVVVLPMWADLVVVPSDVAERWSSVLSLRKTIIAGGIVLVGLVWSSFTQLLLGHPPTPIARSVTQATLWPITNELLNGQEIDDKTLRDNPLASALKEGLATYPDGKFRGAIYTPEAMGDYLVWSLPTPAPVMVYSHVHVFPRGHWEDYMEVLFARPGWKRVLERHRVNLVVSQIEGRHDLLDKLKNDPDWDVVFDPTQSLPSRQRVFAALRKKPL